MKQVESVYPALALIEQFVLVVENLKSFAITIQDPNRSELLVHISSLESLLEILNSSDTTFSYVSPQTLSGRNYKSKIERLGIASEVIRLKGEPGMTLKAIAEHFNNEISEGSIRTFFRFYDKLPALEQAKYQRTSIFDTTQQLENLSIIIQRNLARLEGSNDEVNVKFVAELRQTIAFAAQLAEKMANYERYTEFMQQVIDVLKSELPQKRLEIMKKLQASTSFTLPNAAHTKETEIEDASY